MGGLTGWATDAPRDATAPSAWAPLARSRRRRDAAIRRVPTHARQRANPDYRAADPPRQIRCLNPRAHRPTGEMRARTRLSLALSDAVPAAKCRSGGCSLPPQGELGFCAPCEAVYRAARVLREQLLARRGARLQAAYRELFDALSPSVRARLLAHVAARGADRGVPDHVFDVAGLEDFLEELRDLGLAAWRSP
jgi:hypothetical protein